MRTEQEIRDKRKELDDEIKEITEYIIKISQKHTREVMTEYGMGLKKQRELLDWVIDELLPF